jgi:hypothetical protein
MVILFHEMGIKEKSCTCDSMSNHVIRESLCSRTVALFNETGIKEKSCTCDSMSNHVTCV